MIDKEFLASAINLDNDPQLIAEGISGTEYNVIKYAGRYYGIHQWDGAFSCEKIVRREYTKPTFVGRSLREVSSLIEGLPMDLAQERDELLEREQKLLEVVRYFCRFKPPGHYYTPILSDEDIAARAARSHIPAAKEVPAIDLHEARQLLHLREMAREYRELAPFPAEPAKGQRYYYKNDELAYYDAIVLRHFLLTARPRRVVEVGAGYSSSLMLDVNEQGKMNIKFAVIDPDLSRFNQLVKSVDRSFHEVFECRLQDVATDRFESLESGDILFIDSSHVSKMDSDVNWYMFEILPRLKPGVFVHIHDIGFPFEYPLNFIQQGRCWNESYFLRAFMMYNNAFKVEFFVAFTSHFHIDFIRTEMPMCAERPGGSFWMRKQPV